MRKHRNLKNKEKFCEAILSQSWSSQVNRDSSMKNNTKNSMISFNDKYINVIEIH